MSQEGPTQETQSRDSAVPREVATGPAPAPRSEAGAWLPEQKGRRSESVRLLTSKGPGS